VSGTEAVLVVAIALGLEAIKQTHRSEAHIIRLRKEQHPLPREVALRHVNAARLASSTLNSEPDKEGPFQYLDKRASKRPRFV
jgi:hypothetical protein